MRPISQIIRLKKQLRVIGFDDAPFDRTDGSAVNVSGIVCSDTRFEGMLWGEVSKDGSDATQTLIDMVLASEFYDQIDVVLTDGIALGGFNIIDLPQLAKSLDRPCIAVMRKVPDMAAIDSALQNFEDYSAKKFTMLKAGEIFSVDHFHFQASGCDKDIAAWVLAQLTDTGHVPEALRLAHLIGAAVKTGQSSHRA